VKAAPTSGARQHLRLRELLKRQHGVLSYAQAELLGITYGTIRAQVSAGRWVALSPGVYFTVNGRPGRDAQWWAALLASGAGAVLSHRTAAELYEFGRTVRGLVEVSIPSHRQEVSLPGVHVRRSRLLPHKATVHQGWPVTTAADTVLDLAAGMRSPHDVVALLTEACRGSAVTVEQILEAMALRKRQRHRQLIKDVLVDVRGGGESRLEHRYLVAVERPHGLPVGRRQVKQLLNGVATRKDVEYDEYSTVVELDGRLGHEGSGRHRDRRRDNSSTRQGRSTLRYGHADLEQPCEVAVEVTDVLRQNGWTGVLRPCSPRCRITTC
jgi:hypothetical protein